MVPTQAPRPPRRHARVLSALIILAALTVACRPETAVESALLPAASDPAATACSSTQPSPTLPPDWAGVDAATKGIVAVVVSSRVSVGRSRLLFTVMDSSFEGLASPDLPVQLRLYALDRDARTPAAEVEGTYLDTGSGRGLYRAAVEFTCHGLWGAEVQVFPPDGAPTSARTVFRVTEAGSTPAIGAPAPRSDSLTATAPEEIRKISTDPDPEPRAYRLTVGEAVTSGRPSIIFFATPAFCQSGVCGPTVEMVKRVASDYRDEVEFVIVEPYKLRDTPNGLQPDLDGEGKLQTVSAVNDYGIEAEPHLFVVDANGNVAASFEIVVDEAELRGALEDVTMSLQEEALPSPGA